MPDDPLQGEDLLLFDSGYTNKELEELFRSLAADADLDSLDYFAYGLVLGLCDGGIGALAEGGTMLLHTPRAEIDRRLAAVRAAMKEGATLQQAICTLPGD